jgi:hypothetical protein
MNPETAKSMVGHVVIHATDYRGPTPEEIADRALAKIIYVGDKADSMIAEQARGYREGIRQILVHYLREAQTSERVTICGHLIKGGRADLAEIVRSL